MSTFQHYELFPEHKVWLGRHAHAHDFVRAQVEELPAISSVSKKEIEAVGRFLLNAKLSALLRAKRL